MKKSNRMNQLKTELDAYKAECARLTKMLNDTLEVRTIGQDTELKEHETIKTIEQQQTIDYLK